MVQCRENLQPGVDLNAAATWMEGWCFLTVEQLMFPEMLLLFFQGFMINVTTWYPSKLRLFLLIPVGIGCVFWGICERKSLHSITCHLFCEAGSQNIFHFPKASRSSRKGIAFGKRSNSMKRNPNAAVTKSGWLFKQVDSPIIPCCGTVLPQPFLFLSHFTIWLASLRTAKEVFLAWQYHFPLLWMIFIETLGQFRRALTRWPPIPKRNIYICFPFTILSSPTLHSYMGGGDKK